MRRHERRLHHRARQRAAADVHRHRVAEVDSRRRVDQPARCPLSASGRTSPRSSPDQARPRRRAPSSPAGDAAVARSPAQPPRRPGLLLRHQRRASPELGFFQPTAHPLPACTGVISPDRSWPAGGSPSRCAGVAGREPTAARRAVPRRRAGRPTPCPPRPRGRAARSRARRCSRCGTRIPVTSANAMYSSPRSAAPGSTVTSSSAARGPCTASTARSACRFTTSTPSGAAARSSSATVSRVRRVRHEQQVVRAHEVGDEVVDDPAVVRAAERVLGVAGRDPAQVRREAPVDERRPGPVTDSLPRWLTSKIPTAVRTAVCSATDPPG